MAGIFGTIENPLLKVTVTGYGYGDVTTGLPLLISNIIALIATIGGIALLINFLLAGLDFITASGDPKKVDLAWKKIYISIVGFVVIVAGFLIIGIVGKIFFGDYTALLKPRIFGPGAIIPKP